MYVYMYLYICILVYICVTAAYMCMCEYTWHVYYVRVYARGTEGLRSISQEAQKLTHKRGRNTLDFNRFQHGDGRLGDNNGEVKFGSFKCRSGQNELLCYLLIRYTSKSLVKMQLQLSRKP